MGFIAGKIIKTDRDVIAKFLLYIITPTVIFFGVAKMHNNNHFIIMLPLIIYCMSCIMCMIVYKITAIFFGGSNLRNIIAFSSGSSSTGHFGLPIALMVLDTETIAIYIVSFLGFTLFENTYGFYMAAKGYFTAMDCIKKILKLPAVYAILLGLCVNAMNIPIPPMLDDFFNNIRSTYIVLGISTIGLGLATIKNLSIDWKFVNTTLVVKYILWPMLMIIFVLLDQHYFYLYTKEVYKALLILSIVPISVSTAIVGSVLKYPSDQLAWVVL